MQVVAQFDPTAQVSGTFNSQAYSGCKIIVMNESRANITLDFGNGQSAYMPANDKRAFSITGIMAMPDPNINWSQSGLLNNGQVVNMVTVETFQPDESLPEQYPSPLVRQTNIVGTLTATLLQLFGAVATTPVIEVGANINNLYAEMNAGGQLALISSPNSLAPALQLSPGNTSILASTGGAGNIIVTEFLGPVGFANLANGTNPLRLIILDFNGFKNGTSTVTYTLLNGGISRQTLMLSSDAPGRGFKHGGGPLLNVNLITTLASPNGTPTATTDPQKYNIGFIEGQAWDTIVFDANNGSTHNGAIYILGY